MTGGRARRLGLAVLALVFAIGLLAAPPAASEVRAATPDLTIVSNATYQVRPGDRLVRVTVDMTLKNTLRDTATRRCCGSTSESGCSAARPPNTA